MTRCAGRLQANVPELRRASVIVLDALLWLAILISIGWAVNGFAADATAPPLAGRALGDALRHGGYVLYFRHAATDFGQNDENMTSFEDCTKQRNLTDKGRADARAVGERIKRLHIPVDEVLASPYCRTRETAQLIFGRESVTPDVRGGPGQTDDPQRYAGLRALLSAPVRGPTNRVIVSHGNPFRAVAGTPYLAEGEAAVIEPRGAQGFRVIARIPLDGWAALESS
jgi:phosphohistidine phosphatase SixA